MKVKDLKKQIQDIPDDIEVFIRCCVNPCGNIAEAGSVSDDVYGFFGKTIPCVIIEPVKED